MPIRSALEFFGGREVVRKRLVAAIHDARIRAGVPAAELARLAELPDETTVEKMEAGDYAPAGRVLLDMLAMLGVPLDTILQPEEMRLTPEEKDYFCAAMAEQRIAPMAGSGQEVKADADGNVELFLRFRALSELHVLAP